MQFIVPLGGWGTDFHNMPEDQKHSLANYFLVWGFFDVNILKRDSSFEGIRRSVEKCPPNSIEFVFEHRDWPQKLFALYRKRYLSKLKRYQDLNCAIHQWNSDIGKFIFETFNHPAPSPIDQIITLTLIVSGLADFVTKIDSLEDRIAGLYLVDAITMLKHLYSLLSPDNCIADGQAVKQF